MSQKRCLAAWEEVKQEGKVQGDNFNSESWAAKDDAGMISRKCLWIVVQSIVLILISNNVSADDSISEKSKPDYKWFVSIYGGLNTEENFAKVVVPNASISIPTISLFALWHEKFINTNNGWVLNSKAR